MAIYGHWIISVTEIIPYSGKVWRGESLANLANRLRFAKLKPSKLIVTIDNPLPDLFIRQTFFCQTLENSRFAKHSATKLSHYTIQCRFLIFVNELQEG